MPAPAARNAPRDEEVVAAVASVFQKRDKVETQHRLRTFVEEELQKRKPGAKVSGSRARILALRSGLVRLELRTKTMPGEAEPEQCPACKAKLRRVRNRTLKGGTVLVGLRCAECGYRSGRELEVPTKYVFHRR